MNEREMWNEDPQPSPSWFKSHESRAPIYCTFSLLCIFPHLFDYPLLEPILLWVNPLYSIPFKQMGPFFFFSILLMAQRIHKEMRKLQVLIKRVPPKIQKIPKEWRISTHSERANKQKRLAGRENSNLRNQNSSRTCGQRSKRNKRQMGH